MAGAVSSSALGLVYQVLDLAEPEITIKEYLGRFHVCQRISETQKKVIGEFERKELAELFRDAWHPALR